MKRPHSRSRQRPFTALTLFEILITLSIVALVLLPLTALFIQSTGTVRQSKIESISILIAENVYARLLTDPEWPSEGANQPFSRELDEFGVPSDSYVYDQLYFDGEGLEVTPEEAGRAVYQGTLTFSRSPNYPSRRLDYIAFEIRSIHNSESEPLTFSFQRARTTQRPAE